MAPKETENAPQAAQPSCLGPATAAGRESPGLKLASGSPPRQFHHSLWQARPCGEVMTGSLSGPGQQGVRRRQHGAKSHFPIMLELGKQGKQKQPCMWDLTFALLLLFLHVCTYGVYPVLFFTQGTPRKGKQTSSKFKVCQVFNLPPQPSEVRIINPIILNPTRVLIELDDLSQ